MNVEFKVYKIFMMCIFAAFFQSECSKKSSEYEKRYFEYFSFNKNKRSGLYGKRPRILLLSNNPRWGGASEHVFELYKQALKSGLNIALLVPQDSCYHEELCKLEMDHYIFKKKTDYPSYACLFKALYAVCLNFKPDIIHINDKSEFRASHDVCQNLGISLVAQFHEAVFSNTDRYKDCDAFIGVNPKIVEYMNVKKKERNIKFVELIPPFFNRDLYLNFVAQKTRESFFKDSFSIDIKPIPTVCVIANLYTCKNHELVINAMAKLIQEDNVLVQAFFAGFDQVGREEKLKNLAKSLGIEEFVHFLGFTREVASIIYFSDINILPSKIDSFGLVVLEAALMKKPIIISKNVGAADIVIFNEQTGLICDPDDSADLAVKIKRLLEDPNLCNSLAENAHDLAAQNFSVDALLQKVEQVYVEVYKDKPTPKLYFKHKSLRSKRGKYTRNIEKNQKG